MTLKLPIYLDHHATTPVDPRVREAMLPYLADDFGNPSSATHSFGWKAEAAVNEARRQVVSLIGAKDPKEIIWTSGTTEANNLALIGSARRYRDKGTHLILSAIEHRAVLDVAKYLEGQGFQVTTIPVDSKGLVDPDAVKKAVTSKTILISIMAANNEIGTLQPTAEIGALAKEKGILFHVDAAQACGKIPIDVEAMGIDLLAASAHKVYGPKGVGALYIRAEKPRVQIEPLFYGGGQERGIRPGTLAVANIVGMGRAFELAGQEMVGEAKRLFRLRDRLHRGLTGSLDDLHVNGDLEKRLPGNLNISFPPIRADDLMMRVRTLAVSSGSACASSSSEPSYVIRALGADKERAISSIRFGIGRFNTEEEIDYAIETVVEAVTKLRKN